MTLRPAVALVLLALLSACSSTPTPTPAPTTPAATTTTPTPAPTGLDLYAGTRPAVVPQGTVSEGTLTTPDGRARTYRLFVPDGGLGVAPLVIALHGGLGSGAQFEGNSGFDGLATSNRFIVVYPDGIGAAPDGSTGIRTWNGGDCCGPAAKREVDDVTFLRALVLKLSNSHAIDPDRIYATGHSNGGILALRLACEASDLVAAVGVQSAALGVRQCEPRRPISLMQIHGTADTNIPIEGGKGSGPSGVTFTPPRQAAQTLAQAAGCSTPPTTTTDPANPDLLLEEWSGCPDGTAVEFLAVAGAGHAWMGHDPVSPLAERLVGPPYAGLDSSRALWAFLAAHPRP